MGGGGNVVVGNGVDWSSVFDFRLLLRKTRSGCPPGPSISEKLYLNIELARNPLLSTVLSNHLSQAPTFQK